MAEHVTDVTDQTFESEVLQASELVVVDFWAPWCGPCRMFGPRLEKVAAKLAGQVKAVKVNVDENADTANNYAVRSIPTILFIKGGEVVDKVVGAMEEADLEAKCQALSA